MQFVDYALIVTYLVLLLVLGLMARLKKGSGAGELILGGRTLTLPAFVASLVSTWYGGILGVGEYSFLYGLSTWLVFGLPYYLAAVLFAVFLARRARRSQLLTIPDKLAQVYGNSTALVGSSIVYFMTVPAAYILMLGTLCSHLFGWSAWVGILAGTTFSVVYVFTGGFRSVVRTDLFQFSLMFVGFGVLLAILYSQYGGYDFLRQSVPEELFSWHGGNSPLYIASWYGIALAALIEPAFYQRCYAAKTESVARNGIFVSIACWTLFDFMTTTCGIYARALIPDLADPVASFPALAMEVLPAGLLGLFALALLATVMSTIDSNSFLAASTFGNDIIPRLIKGARERVTFFTRVGLLISTGLAVLIALFFESVIQIWYVFGSVGTPALLVPLFSAFVGKRHMSPGTATLSMLLCGGLSAVWFFAGTDGVYWFGIEPVFPGLALSVVVYLAARKEIA